MNVNISNLDTTIEHWASIDGYLNYQVSWWGRVVNTKTGRILKPGTAKGYLFVVLCRNGVRKIHFIHKLVAHEWVPNPDGKRCVDHMDAEKVNNNLENLRCATYAENDGNRKNQSGSSSVYKGVSWNKHSNKWSGQIRVNRVKHHLGFFESEREAREAYNAAALFCIFQTICKCERVRRLGL